MEKLDASRVITSERTRDGRDEDGVARMTLDEFLCGPCDKLELEKGLIEEDIERLMRRQMREAGVDESGLPGDPKFMDFDRLRRTQKEAMMTSIEEAEKLLRDGLISQEEYDEFMDRMTRLREMEDASSVDDRERTYETFVASNGREFKIPSPFREQERPLPEEIRSSDLWEKSVHRDWCTTEGVDHTAIGLSPEDTKCAVCQNYNYLMLLGGIESLREVAEEVESRINVLGIIRTPDCPTLMTSDFGVVKFKNTEELKTLWNQFQVDYATHVSISQFGSMFDILIDRTRAEWKAFDTWKEETRCYHDLTEDLASRMCVQSKCCRQSLRLGCPEESTLCSACENLVNHALHQNVKSAKWKLSPGVRPWQLERFDGELMRSLANYYEEWRTVLDERARKLMDEEQRIRSYWGSLKDFASDHLSKVIALLHPVLNCVKIRRKLNDRITSIAQDYVNEKNKDLPERKRRKPCIAPKLRHTNTLRLHYAMKRKRDSCLDVYREKLAEEYAQGDESLIDADTVCASLVDDVLEDVVRSSLREDEVLADGEETSFVKLWLRKNLVRQHKVRMLKGVEEGYNILLGEASRCCVAMINAWNGGYRGKDVAKTFDTVTIQERKDEALE
eukprot:g5290.t1